LVAISTRRLSPVTLEATADQQQQQIITFSKGAIAQIHSLREKQGVDTIHLRMGVRAGGCSGMSYVLDVMNANDVGENDTIIDYDGGIRCCIDPKSLMFLYGLKLDYSDVRAAGPFRPRACRHLAWPACGRRVPGADASTPMLLQELIGGGFNFMNPNAEETCGCGKSFGV
jgi:iron-sulfur cluster assembly protein